MITRWIVFLGLFLCAGTMPVHTAIFGVVRGSIRDVQNSPVPDCAVTLKARASEWAVKMAANSEGEFQFATVPAGRYDLTIVHPGFRTVKQLVEVQSGSAPSLHFVLEVAAINVAIEVSDSPLLINPDSSATESIVGREELARTPGADRTHSLTMITDFIPSAAIVHDQLHVRGGHQSSRLIDGVPVPNTNLWMAGYNCSLLTLASSENTIRLSHRITA